jgi:2-phospho-L-lactate guanylyltransferase
MKRWLIVPAKPFDEAKSRLAGVLPSAERTALSAALLDRTLHIATESNLFEHIIVVSRDPVALALAERAGAGALPEAIADLNAALAQAANHAAAAGAAAALLLPADLPYLCGDDLRDLTAAFIDQRTVVLAPSRDGGTNALFLPLPPPFAFAFGPDSGHAHQKAAAAAGCIVRLVQRATLSFDLDSPADLQEMLAAVRSG